MTRAFTGADTRGGFYYEVDSSGNPDFATTSTSDSEFRAFGDDVTIDTAEFDNNFADLFDPGSREASKRVAQQFSGSWSASFILSNPDIWRAVVADVTTTGSSAPYTHTFSGSVPYPIQIVLPNEGTGNERILRGCVVSECTLDVSNNGLVNVNVSGAYADEEATSPGTGSIESQPTSGHEPLTFADGELSFAGTSYELIQSVSITISNGTELKPGLGSRFMQAFSPRVRRVTVDWDKLVENDNRQTTAYGGSSATSPQDRIGSSEEFGATITFDNGAASGASEQNKQVINLSGTLPDSYSRDGTGDPSADYLENNSYTGRVLDDVTVTNADSTVV